MTALKSRVFIGALCFVVGALVSQKLSSKPIPDGIAAEPKRVAANSDSSFDSSFFRYKDDPFEQMRKIRNQMVRRFEEPDEEDGLFSSWGGARIGSQEVAQIKKREDQNFVYLDIAVKDVDRNKLKVKVVDGQISVSGQVERKSEEEGSRSFFTSSFHQSFPAPPEADTDKVQFEQNKEGLTLKFPKKMGA